jgi:hypothetical protein
MKRFRMNFAVLGLVLLAAGCGKSDLFIPGKGNLTGYIYAKNYNSASALRMTARSARQTVPDGYVAVVGAKVEILKSNYAPIVTGADGKFEFKEVMEGTYTLRATKEGVMQPLEFTATVRKDQTTVVNDTAPVSDLTMNPAATGTLMITASVDCQVAVPVQGYVYVNEIKTFVTTPIAVLSYMSPGNYSVKVVADGYQTSSSQDTAVTKGGTSNLSFLLTPVGNSKPFARIITPADGTAVTQGNAVAFTGAGVDCEDGAITGAGLTWTSSLDGQLGTGANLSVSTLSVGTHTITLKATDSGGAFGTSQITLKVNAAGPNTAPTASLISPASGASFSQGQNVTFLGAGTDTQDGVLSGNSIVWTSSRDGQIGTGVAFQKNNLTLGTHTITLTVTDSGGLTHSVSESITITAAPSVNTAPAAQIVAPINGGIFTAGTSVRFAGAAADTEDGALTGSSLVWTSNRDGQLGTGVSFTKNNLSQGAHNITLTATDSGGLTNAVSVSISIVSAPTNNNPPVAVIATPRNGAQYLNGSNILFIGGAADVEDGALTGSSLVWLSDRDGQLGTGTTFQKTSLSVGTHAITLVATDSKGATGSATASVTITP